jgi:replicative DNA helicase
MGAIELGEELASIDGQPSFVTGVFPQGVEKVYRVTFSDGRSTECSGQHLWKVHFVHQYSEGYGDEKHNGWKTFTTDAIREFCLNGNRKNSHRTVFVPLVSGEFGSSSPLLIDPWLLGILLGDGGLTGDTPTITKPDKYIIDRVRNIVEPMGLVLNSDERMTYRIAQAQGPAGIPKDQYRNPLTQQLRELGLMGCDGTKKSIPTSYLYADRESRLALLQGLMDSDGTAGKTKETSYSTCSEHLAWGVQYLVRSLGGICSISERHPKCRYKGEIVEGQLAYILNIRMPNREGLFTLPRKQARVPAFENRQPRLTIKSIDYVGEQETQCISVSHPSKLYITNDFIVTHNTSFMVTLAVRTLDYNNDAIVLFHTIDDHVALFLSRICAVKYGFPSKWFKQAGKYVNEDEKFRQAFYESKQWLREMVETDRFLPLDVTMLPRTITSLEAKVKELRRAYPSRPIVVFGDNFHLYQTMGNGNSSDEAGVRALSMASKTLANTHGICLMMTMELPKASLKPGERPRIMNIKGSAGVSYDSSANIGVYNDLKDFREYAQLVWNDGGVIKPVVEVVFDKSKLDTGFDGNIYYKFYPESGYYEEIPEEEQGQWAARALAGSKRKSGSTAEDVYTPAPSFPAVQRIFAAPAADYEIFSAAGLRAALPGKQV